MGFSTTEPKDTFGLSAEEQKILDQGPKHYASMLDLTLVKPPNPKARIDIPRSSANEPKNTLDLSEEEQKILDRGPKKYASILDLILTKQPNPKAMLCTFGSRDDNDRPQKVDQTALVDILQPKAIITAAEGLCRLPRELVHQILDDLPLLKILQLIASQKDSTYLRECLLGQQHLQIIFPTMEHLVHIQNMFALYYEIGSILHCSLDIPPTSFPIISMLASRGSLVTYSFLRHYLQKKLTAWLDIAIQYTNVLGQRGRHRLGQYFEQRAHRDWHDPSYSGNNRLWIALKFELCKEVDIKVDQLYRLAQIVEFWPTKVKKSSDPSQKPRSNFQHLTNQMGLYARVWARKPDVVLRRDYLFNSDLFPLVPYDDCLNLFLNTLEEYPLPQAAIAAFDTMIPECYCTKNLEPDFVLDLLKIDMSDVPNEYYPKHILRDIAIVILGMKFVYTMPRDTLEERAPKILKTKFTP